MKYIINFSILYIKFIKTKFDIKKIKNKKIYNILVNFFLKYMKIILLIFKILKQ